MRRITRRLLNEVLVHDGYDNKRPSIVVVLYNPRGVERLHFRREGWTLATPITLGARGYYASRRHRANITVFEEGGPHSKLMCEHARK